MEKGKMAVAVVLAFALSCVFSGATFADPTGNGGTPAMDADSPQGTWQNIQDRMAEMDGLSNQELIALIGQGGTDALLAGKELISRGADAVPDILEALKDPDTQNFAQLAGVLAKIVKDNPALQKQVLAELSEIANDPDNIYSNEQQLAAAKSMVAIGGKAAFASLSKDMKMQLAKAMLEKAYDVHSTNYWHNKPGHRWDPWPNR